MLQRIFLGHPPQHVIAEWNEARHMDLTGIALLRRLEAVRERYRLNPPESGGADAPEAEVMRIVCSDGLV